MNEKLLHFIWKLKLFPVNKLKTTANNDIKIFSVGFENSNSGPDFLNAKLSIDNQLWYGNVEMHIKASDWYLHKHQNDENYNAVILHVVWEADIEVSHNNYKLPTLCLQNYISKNLLSKHKQLFNTKVKYINCENQLPNLKSFQFIHFKQQLILNRLVRKTLFIEKVLVENKNDWEATLFVLLAKNFGLKINSDAFYNIAKSIDFKVVRKILHNTLQFEALLFGQANLLNDEIETDEYYFSLKKEYVFLKTKFKLQPILGKQIQFFRLRPYNFPTIRLSQLANLYATHKSLFSKVISSTSLDSYYKLFEATTSSYWENHYTFGNKSSTKVKRVSKNFINLLLINTILPLKFLYSKQNNTLQVDDFFNLFQQIKSEKNSTISTFSDLGFTVESALDSQALIELKTQYCNQHKCLSCSIGKEILTS